MFVVEDLQMKKSLGEKITIQKTRTKVLEGNTLELESMLIGSKESKQRNP